MCKIIMTKNYIDEARYIYMCDIYSIVTMIISK